MSTPDERKKTEVISILHKLQNDLFYKLRDDTVDLLTLCRQIKQTAELCEKELSSGGQS